MIVTIVKLFFIVTTAIQPLTSNGVFDIDTPLIEQKPAPKGSNQYKIHSYAIHGNLNKIKTLYEKKRPIPERYLSEALNLASLSANQSVVIFILSKGIDINSFVLRDASTPLIQAIKGYYLASVHESFIKQKYRPEFENFSTIRTSKANGILALLDKSEHLKMINFLIKQGADVNKTGYKSWSPLAFASRIGSVEVVCLLIKNGAEINHKNSYGKTPLDYASNSQVKIMLEKSGAKSGKEKS